MSKDKPDIVLSDSDERVQKSIRTTTELCKQILDGFDEICEVLKKVESDELTIKEGQTEIDIISEKYSLNEKMHKFR